MSRQSHVVLTFPFECKTLGDSGEIEGYASTFGNVDHGGDRVIKGAFLGTPTPLPMRFQHEETVGVWNELREDSRGLLSRGHLTLEVERAREAHALAKAGAIKGLSVGGFPERDGIKFDDDGVREIHKMDLKEISLTWLPMNELAGLTSVKSEIVTVQDFERLMRQIGFSRREARGLADKGWRGIAGSTEQDIIRACIARWE